MESIALKASLRKETGKKSSKTIRNEEGIPCVLYGEKENINFMTTEKDFRCLIFTPHVYMIHIDIDGNIHNAVIKDLQFHPVTDKLIHADFYEISDTKAITIEIPVKITGSSIGVREGGRLVIERRKVKLKGFPKDIPAEIEVDVTELSIGKSIRAGDIATGGKFDVVLSKEAPIASVRMTRAAAAAAQEAAKKEK